MPHLINSNSQMQHLGRQRVGPLRYSGPPRPVPLPERPPQGKLRTDLTYDWREIGEQVSTTKVCTFHMRVVKFSAIKAGCIEARTLQLCPVQIGVLQISKTENRIVKICTKKIGTF